MSIETTCRLCGFEYNIRNGPCPSCAPNLVKRGAVARMADAFRQFARNGRCGTCRDCPRDGRADAFPEYCKHTNRPDHQLGASSLAEQFEGDLREAKKRAKEERDAE